MNDHTPTGAGEWDQFEARDTGRHRPEQPWILSDRDVWHKNPFYTGPPVPHPEQEPHEEPGIAEQYEQQRATRQRERNDGLTDAELARETWLAIQLARMYDATDDESI